METTQGKHPQAAKPVPTQPPGHLVHGAACLDFRKQNPQKSQCPLQLCLVASSPEVHLGETHGHKAKAGLRLSHRLSLGAPWLGPVRISAEINKLLMTQRQVSALAGF